MGSAYRHTPLVPSSNVSITGRLALTGLYLAGVFLKGGMWAAAYRWQNPRDPRWIYRPLMSVLSAVVLSTLIVYSAATLRRNVWWRA